MREGVRRRRARSPWIAAARAAEYCHGCHISRVASPASHHRTVCVCVRVPCSTSSPNISQHSAFRTHSEQERADACGINDFDVVSIDGLASDLQCGVSVSKSVYIVYSLDIFGRAVCARCCSSVRRENTHNERARCCGSACFSRGAYDVAAGVVTVLRLELCMCRCSVYLSALCVCL